jgi:ATP-dependent RNA helicase SUPV3L1/SUV3
MRRLRENAMLEAEITASGDVTVEGQHVGHLHGFHFVPDPQAETAEAKTLRNAASKALAGEIESRADRFSAAADSSLVLSNDGTIRWMGDPVAKLEPGDKVFEPRLRILADEQLTGPARDKVETRLQAWLKAYVVRLLGPVMQLEEAPELVGLARGIAFQIAEALGVLERSKVLNEVRSLDQDSRAALRKAGVRFGAYHLYLPALLKPAPRTLAAQLWALQNGGLEQRGIDEIAHLASSGRTSIPVDPAIAAGLYRAAGFRVCGGRAVRVDILERLADLIRPAIAYRPGITPGEPPAGTADGEGFVPTVGMTSLVGCAGEDFASILKSLGYVAERRPGPAITVPLASAPAEIAPAPAPAPEAGEPEDQAAAPAGETPPAEAAEPAPAEPASAETPAQAPAAEPAAEAPVSEPAAEAPVSEPAASVEQEALHENAAEASPAEVEQAAPDEAAEPAEPVLIEVWRQGRRHEGGHARHGRGRPERGERRQDNRGRHERGERQHGDRPPRHERRAEGQGEGGRPQNRPPRGPRPDQRHDRRDGGGPDRRREDRREKQPDPNSPFAKLMALKAQLEDPNGGKR